jgi:V8-like Glu-specific endopeptidase
MKRITLLAVLGFFNLSLFAQTNSNPVQLEYPFAEPGTDVSRGVFGADDRKEIKDAEGFKQFARATAVMISKESIYNDEFYSWSLRERLTRQFETDRFDSDVKFLDQPVVGSCTGFLIAPDIMVTAGHCINSMEDANKFVWVFDYTSESDFINGRRLQFKDENIFEVESIIASDLDDDTDDDYSILRLKRKSNRAPYRFRTSGTVLEGGAINTIGCPTGLPLKFSTNAQVTNNEPSNWFKSNIDAFPGNSGGPVFDKNGFIEGILVRGAVEYDNGSYTGDYKYDSDCDCVKTVQWDSARWTAGCQAHKITAIPYNTIVMSIYENLKYAILTNNTERFNSWKIYSWVFNKKYTNATGRLETAALNTGNLSALSSILEITSKDLSDDYARSLIDITMADNDSDALKVLLANDILADAGANSTYSALQTAVKQRKTQLIELLIDYGADINVKASNGDTLLHLAAKTGNAGLTKLLLNKGLNPSLKNIKGVLPEKTAKKNRHRSLYKILKKARKKR